MHRTEGRHGTNSCRDSGAGCNRSEGDPEGDPAADAVEGTSTRAALALIATLPADQAEAIALRVVAGLEVSRVAEIMGKRPGTVRVLTHRGLRRLAARLGADSNAAARRVV